MSRPWIAAAAATSLSAFAIAYVVASPGAATPPAQKLAHRLARLEPGPPPQGWRLARVPGSPAVLAYPRGWQPIAGDRGTVSVALRAGERIVGYLNATPQSGEETPANWLSFRLDHNRDEGERNVTALAGARGLRFRTGRGSCLIDDYTTAADIRYRELACIVAGRRATTVVVGSAAPGRWSRLAPVLRRAVASFTT